MKTAAQILYFYVSSWTEAYDNTEMVSLDMVKVIFLTLPFEISGVALMSVQKKTNAVVTAMRP